MKEKVPPQAIDVEMVVLGAMLIEKEAILKAMDIIADGDFYEEIHRQIFVTIRSLYVESQPVDLFTVTNALKKSTSSKVRDLFDNKGGASYLASLVNSIQTTANIEHHACIVRDKSILRRLMDTGSQIYEDAVNERSSPDEILDKSQTVLFNILQRQSKKRLIGVSNLVSPMLQKLEKLHLNSKDISGLATGFADLDIKTAGLQPSELIILAGRPSMGKTALALNIAEHVAIEQRKPVAIFSLEMKQEALVSRFLASIARVNAGKLRNGQYSASDWPRLTSASAKIAQAPIFIDDDANINVIELRARARKLAIELESKGMSLALVIIDYIQFMRTLFKKSISREQEVSEISRALKALAKDLNVPVIALSQLSRRTEDKGRVNNRPQLSDLRDSGAIEQDADVVAMLYREGYYNREDPDLQKKATLIIGKQRNGPTGDVNLIFEGEYMKFSDESKIQDDR